MLVVEGRAAGDSEGWITGTLPWRTMRESDAWLVDNDEGGVALGEGLCEGFTLGKMSILGESSADEVLLLMMGVMQPACDMPPLIIGSSFKSSSLT